MVSVTRARKRLTRAQRRAVAINHRKRRDSHRGYPDQHQTHSIEPGGSLTFASFSDPSRPVTFKFRVDFSGILLDATSVDGKIADWPDGSIGFDVGRLEVVTGGSIFRVPVFGNPTDHAEIVVAFKPVLGQVRAWVDSYCVLSADTFLTAYNWITSGALAYDSVPGATVLDNFEIFDGTLPRHFDECAASTGVVFCPLLYRAARATFQVDEWPFLGEH